MKLAKLLKMRNQLTDSEKTFFDYSIENPHKLNNNNIIQIANELFISKTTISRACQKLGFSGFKEFKYSLLSEDSDGENSNIPNKSRVDFYELINNRLEKTIELIDDTTFDKIIELIKTSENIEVFSVGGSYSSGLELSRKLRRLDYNINTRSDWDELEVISKRLTDKDLAIFLSQTGETKMLLDYQNNLVKNGCPIISIIGAKDSSLGTQSTVVLYAPTVINYKEDIDLSSRVSFIFIIDLISWELSENS